MIYNYLSGDFVYNGTKREANRVSASSECLHITGVRETLFLSYTIIEEESTYGQTNQIQIKLLLNLFVICIDELVFPTWFYIFLLIKYETLWLIFHSISCPIALVTSSGVCQYA